MIAGLSATEIKEDPAGHKCNRPGHVLTTFVYAKIYRNDRECSQWKDLNYSYYFKRRKNVGASTNSNILKSNVKVYKL